MYLFWMLHQPKAGTWHHWYGFSHRQINAKQEATFCNADIQSDFLCMKGTFPK